jgi:DNA-binding winged helix-turn-helix (wHTH) protein/Tol biopolymer transport system component
MSVLTRNRVRFGPFELDGKSGELFKLGQKLNLRGQPIEVLSILLECPGELVNREEFCQRLWPQDTFVDFEHSLNTAIKKLRQTLDDNPDAPRYIETLPKKGYRFIAQVEPLTNGVDPIAEPANGPPLPPAGSDEADKYVRRKSRRWKLVAAITLVLAIAAGSLYWLYRPRTLVVTGIHQLTRTGHQKSSALSFRVVTDGTRIYFDEIRKDGLRVAQISTKGGDVSYLDIPPVRSPWIADISADGSELLLFDPSTNWDNPVWLATLPNGPQRRIDDLKVAFAAFVPGTNQLIYNQSSDLRQLFTVDVEGGKPRPLLSAPDTTLDFSVSPDGKRIRIVGGSQGWEAHSGSQIWEAYTDGTGLRRFLPQLEEPICCGHWSADGRIYAFAVQDKDGSNLWAVTESGPADHPPVSPPVQLTYGSTSYSTPTFSKDGKQLYVLGNAKRGELAVYDTASGEFRSYLNGISAGFVDFSRDGQWVTYVSYPQNILWRSRIDGSERLQLTFPPMGPALNPKWSPDGHLIAFTEWGETRKIYLVPATGGTPMLLLGGDSQPADPNWSPDGKSILYGGASVSGESVSELRILNLGTKQSASLPGSQHMFSPRWSPDGHYIAALSDNMTKLFLYSFENARWKQVPLPGEGGVGWPSWSHDSRYLYVLHGPLWKFRVPDGTAEAAPDISNIDTTVPIFSGAWFALTPDDRVLVMRDRGIDELYALDLEYR